MTQMVMIKTMVSCKMFPSTNEMVTFAGWGGIVDLSTQCYFDIIKSKRLLYMYI